MVEEDIEFDTVDGNVITKSGLREDIINDYISAGGAGLTKITDFTIGSEAYHLADIMAKFKLEFRELIDMCYRMAMIHYAEGEFLDNYGDMRGVHRRGSSPSVGEVTFSRIDSEDTNSYTIRDGLQLATNDAISFIVNNDGQDVILTSDMTSVTVPALCMVEGAYTNVAAHSISIINDSLGNQLEVDNESVFTEGEDIESDEEYRQRILLSSEGAITGTLEWYTLVGLTLDSVQDIKTIKSDISSAYHMELIFAPVDWTDMEGDITLAEFELRELFDSQEYCIPGVNIDFVPVELVSVLVGSDYKFAVLVKDGYTLPDVKEAIINKINQFNLDAHISNEFQPGTIATLIENEVEGVINCRIVYYDTEHYVEVVEPISMEDDQLYKIDTTDLSDRIVNLNFNLSIEVEE